MYLWAYSAHPHRFDYYVMSEVDYVPLRADFDRVLVELYRRAFAARSVGALVAVLQGRPVEGARHKQHLHPQGTQIMHAAAMQTLFDRTYGTPRRWRRSLSARMVHLVRRSGTGRYSSNRFDQIQEGFGMLCAEAGVPMLDYTAAYRSPYWTHSQVVEWTSGGAGTVASGASVAGGGAVASVGSGGGGREPPPLPMHRVLFVPVQVLFLRRLKRCCALAFSKCRARGLTCEVADWRADADCCGVGQLPSLEMRQAKLNHSVSPEQARCTSHTSHVCHASLTSLLLLRL